MAISFVGAGTQTTSTTSGATLTATWPSGYTATANDVGVLIVAGKQNSNNPSVPSVSGWDEAKSYFYDIGTYDLQICVYTRRLAGGDSAPSLTVPSEFSGTSAGISIQLAIYRGVSTTTILDTTAKGSSAGLGDTWSMSGVYLAQTTVTHGAWALAAVATSDDNALGLVSGSERGFTLRMSGANYDTTDGGDHSVGLADLALATAGAVTWPTWQQTLNGIDYWVGVTLVLRPEPTVVSRTATYSGTGTQSATGLRSALRTATGTGTGTQSATGLRTALATASGSGTGSESATGLRTTSTAATGSATGSESATGLRTTSTTATGSATGTESTTELRTTLTTAAGSAVGTSSSTEAVSSPSVVSVTAIGESASSESATGTRVTARPRPGGGGLASATPRFQPAPQSPRKRRPSAHSSVDAIDVDDEELVILLAL